eukprot:COSAG02_NODE_101_length_36804_cov_125.342951_2_plen_62_part_00
MILKVLESIKANNELIQFDNEVCAVMWHGWYHACMNSEERSGHLPARHQGHDGRSDDAAGR